MSKIIPMYSKILVKPRLEETTTKSGIYLTGKANQRKQIADVIEVGNGYILNDGNIRPLFVRKGDVIIYEKFSGTLIHHDDDYLIIDERDILAKIDD